MWGLVGSADYDSHVELEHGKDLEVEEEAVSFRYWCAQEVVHSPRFRPRFFC